MSAPPERARDGAPLDRLLARRLEVNWTLVAWIAIFAAAFALRFWDLGARALHHDESIHARWAWDLAQGSYRHSPTFHGPLLYFVQGFTFLLFTATDYTSRISPALFGMLVVAAPLALRRWLGSTGALAAGALLAFSPTLVYFSRFLRMDIYLAVFILAMVVAVWSYLHDGRTRWLIVLALALSLAFSTKEAAFLFVAFLLLYLNGHLAIDLAQASRRARGEAAGWRTLAFAAALYPFAWGIAALWPFLERLRPRLGWRALPRTGDLIVLTGTLTLPLLTPFAKNALERLFSSGSLDYPAICASPSTEAAATLAFGFVVTIGLAAFAGIHWRPRTWLIAAAGAALIYATLMTSLWTNLEGLCSGAWGSLDYWQAQQDVRRGGQPWFYYLMLMPAYEFLPLALALVGGAWALWRGSAFARFLTLWFVVIFAALSFAGEKMPWLNTHLAIPAILLAAWTLDRAWRHWRPARLAAADLFALAVALAVAALIPALLVFFRDQAPALAIPLALLALAAALLGARLGRRSLPFLAALVLVAALAFFSIRAMIGVTFERSDTPHDILIYTQSSPDITRLADEIDALADASGKGLDLRIAIDSRDSFAWPWSWYLRDYRSVAYVDMTNGFPAGDFDVVLVNQSNDEVVSRDLEARGALASFAPPFQYPHRWWFPERYKGALTAGPLEAAAWRQIGGGLFRGNWARDAFAYWRDHEAPAPFGSIDGFAYFPLNFDRDAGRLSRAPAPDPAPSPTPDPPPTLDPATSPTPATPVIERDSAGRPAFGSTVAFGAPVDIAEGPDGSLYVIDSLTAIIQKFGPDGAPLAAVALRTGGEPSGPWGLAVAPDGVVYVADTFGWRILALDANLSPILSFGQPPLRDGAPPSPDQLFGPRDLAVDGDGNLWVTDTGHHRILVYSPAGEFLRAIAGPWRPETFHQGAGPAQFREPVGIDIAPNGEIVIADAGNARVQTLDPSGRPLREFPVPGWGGGDAQDKPYLRVLRDGRIALSLPLLGEVRIYSAEGTPLAAIAPADDPIRLPYGILERPDGKLWIVEGGAARVRLFDIEADGER